jgi:8-oxo-dGTP pyrophosphatase MutT (NUDIX family)
MGTLVAYRPPSWPVSIKGVAIDAHGQVLLLRNERQEWELPGGRPEIGDPAAGMRGDDSPEQALERETLEETGWRSRRARSSRTAPGYTNPSPVGEC